MSNIYNFCILGPIITILMLLSSLNSFVNPFIYLFFNQNLVKSLLHFCCRVKMNEDFNKTNASEMQSNYNYEHRNPSQSSFEEENRKNNTFPLTHRSDNSDITSKRLNKHHFRTRRSNIRRKNNDSNDRNVSDI